MAKGRIISKEKKTNYIKCMNYGECKNKFYSEGKYHRLCHQCRRKSY